MYLKRVINLVFIELLSSVFTGYDNANGEIAKVSMYPDISNNPFGDAIANPLVHKNKRASIPDKTFSLFNEPKCVEDLRRLCSNLKPDVDDLSVLICIQSNKADIDLSKECQHVVWKHTTDLMDFNHLDSLRKYRCRPDDWKDLTKNCIDVEKKTSFLSCLVDNLEVVKDAVCQNFIHQIQLVAFIDFRILSDFTETCTNDIERLFCGRVHHDNEGFSQGRTLNCLQQKIDTIGSVDCKKQVLHLSSVQESDVRFDRLLYAACSEERHRFCQDMAPGTGQIYKCLMQHKMDKAMSEKCEEQLFKHEKMISQDYRVSKGLARSCREYIKQFHCRRLVSDDRDIRLAQILLCLENNMKNGSKVSHECQSEMMEHRKMLLEDYRLSPEIVSSCSKDIPQLCGGDLELGKTIHCLLEHSRYKRKKGRVSDSCQVALQALIKETDAGENWNVDPVLKEACKHVVSIACRDIRDGEARVMSCLLDQLGTELMSDECEQAVMQIQYFVARDYRLDPHLFRECKEDAATHCHGSRAWHDVNRMHPSLGPLVLPCLYRYVYLSPEQNRNNIKLKPGCVDEIKRIMRVRAISVDLQPEIEMYCIKDLADFCYDKTGVGEEMVCLQDNLDSLQENCKRQVFNFTQAESDNIELNPIVLQTCKVVINSHCEAEYRSKDAGSVMECLIQNKNERDVTNYKCKAAIEHFQLITMKDYHFTPRFENACKDTVLRFCSKPRTKADVIFCLSELVRNNTITDTRFSVPKNCRQQLKAQLFNQRENAKFDPRLMKFCSLDIKKYCKEASQGNSEVLECLKQIKNKLSVDCHKYVFATELQDMADSSTDYTLLTTCKPMILFYCRHTDMSQVLPCLKRFKDEPHFDQKCKGIVMHRMIEQSSDYRLNPSLQRSCKKDIDKFCSDVLVKESHAIELEGKVIKCLQLKFIKKKLRLECEQEMSILLREAALNYQLIPVLKTVCENEIKNVCSKTDDSLGSGAVLECLKTALLNDKIRNKDCQTEVAGLIEEAKADIHVDPLLQRACAVDVSKFCGSVTQGAGRHIQCLMSIITENSENKKLQFECYTMLKQRMDMFSYAEKLIVEPPDTIEDLIGQVKISPSRTYFSMVLLTIVGMIFIMGLFCGRISRHSALLKNK